MGSATLRDGSSRQMGLCTVAVGMLCRPTRDSLLDSQNRATTAHEPDAPAAAGHRRDKSNSGPRGSVGSGRLRVLGSRQNEDGMAPEELDSSRSRRGGGWSRARTHDAPSQEVPINRPSRPARQKSASSGCHDMSSLPSPPESEIVGRATSSLPSSTRGPNPRRCALGTTYAPFPSSARGGDASQSRRPPPADDARSPRTRRQGRPNPRKSTPFVHPTATTR